MGEAADKTHIACRHRREKRRGIVLAGAMHPQTLDVVANPRGCEYWPLVPRIDDVAGDRSLVCSCPPIEALAS